ncbi:TetR/AcrR family transcriptional regulator [Shewanella dokdonensis]|uniref:TetR/AcrR family transcriptional regulator n=1 Tax=Shewanella dokdonensis TaxID=712036 RepID=A0ABX8DIZ2_9GAMM|nr:TetR/AcrR family transcriptional regulator [Shewanella dokdonensis]MCL1076135.1 TetR/AcrR family transcriptional regulator [Shewanella dokdonensis]QVK24474.1 TetR/AcrR family transcriptional regulator [Shewanella dokdonensis]
MPKIVNHEQRRQELALQAAAIFLEHGYKNLGMRQLCQQLGMSKSAVYHYYQSKDELFKAATDAIINFDGDALVEQPLAVDASPAQRVANFIVLFRQIAPRFFQELQLVADYIQVIGEANVAEDPSMMLANRKYLDLFAKYVSAEKTLPLFTLMLGLLCHQMMLGQMLDDDYVAELVQALLAC